VIRQFACRSRAGGFLVRVTIARMSRRTARLTERPFSDAAGARHSRLSTLATGGALTQKVGVRPPDWTK
jgi:hypothetical protein